MAAPISLGDAERAEVIARRGADRDEKSARMPSMSQKRADAFRGGAQWRGRLQDWEPTSVAEPRAGGSEDLEVLCMNATL